MAVKYDGIEKIKITSQNKFYHIIENLYLVKLPEDGDKEIAIEDLYSADLINKYRDATDPKKIYKLRFSKEVRQLKKENFVNFVPLLDRINDCIQDYENRLPKAEA